MPLSIDQGHIPRMRHEHRHDKPDGLVLLKMSLLFLKLFQEAGVTLTGIKISQDHLRDPEVLLSCNCREAVSEEARPHLLMAPALSQLGLKMFSMGHMSFWCCLGSGSDFKARKQIIRQSPSREILFLDFFFFFFLKNHSNFVCAPGQLESQEGPSTSPTSERTT